MGTLQDGFTPLNFCKTSSGGCWVAQPALDFSSGLDLRVCELEPRIRLSADSVQSTWDFGILSLPVSLPLPCSLSKINLKKKNPLTGKPGSERSEGKPLLPHFSFTYPLGALQARAREWGVRMALRDWTQEERGYPE